MRVGAVKLIKNQVRSRLKVRWHLGSQVNYGSTYNAPGSTETSSSAEAFEHLPADEDAR